MSLKLAKLERFAKITAGITEAFRLYHPHAINRLLNKFHIELCFVTAYIIYMYV